MARKATKALTKKLAEDSAKPEPNVLRSTAKPGETKIAKEAEFMVEGLAMNALVGLAFSSKLGTLDLTEAFAQMILRARQTTNRDTKSQEAILAGQVVALNAIFTDLAIIARQNMSNATVFERLMRLALKAQSNCRATAEALATIQNPPTVFARQANFAAGPQQINNGSTQSPSRAGDFKSAPNELLEANEVRMDKRSTATTGKGDPQLATVGPFNRSENRRG